jgi:hypothetical protein
MHSDEHASRPRDLVLLLLLPSFPQVFLLVSLGMLRKRKMTIWMVRLLGVGGQLPFDSRLGRSYTLGRTYRFTYKRKAIVMLTHVTCMEVTPGSMRIHCVTRDQPKYIVGTY